MSISAFSTTLIHDKSPTKQIKRLVNNKLTRFNDIFGNASFIIKPAAVIYDNEKKYYHLQTENLIDEAELDDTSSIIVNLEAAELKNSPKVFANGKYNTITQALAQAKYNYPNRFVLIKHSGRLPYIALVVMYRKDLDEFKIINSLHKAHIVHVYGDIV